MLPRLAAAALVVAVAAWIAPRGPSPRLRVFPAGVTEVHREIHIAGGAEVRGIPGRSVLRAAADFEGRAVLVVDGDGARVRDLVVDGNRDALEVRAGLPGYDTPFARFTRGNGLLADGAADLVVRNVTFRAIAGFAVLVSRGRNVTIDRVRVSGSGSRNPAGRNNTTGGILLEEGTRDFRVTGCELRDIRGNGIWTHSLYTSPRNARGVFAGNRLERIGRDALQVGHATAVRVERNQGAWIGFPVEDVDVENRAIPVAVDTAGNVDLSVYAGNDFREIDGKCFDLDGFHDGTVRGNVCINRRDAAAYPFGGYGVVMNNTNPDMQSRNVAIEDNLIQGAKFGGVFVIGSHNVVRGNLLLDLNTAHCNEDAARFGCYYAPGEPEMLESGIYLGRGAERPAPARANLIERNRITGWKMAGRCIARAPGIEAGWNTVRANDCR
ncbi:MAG: right-handed parallel beta-helix repeat-containing protein [Acidobacteria bacterium]|nr:right-handed parallel beta-helix repeat-containing protein [Acidobacteriota bacterium]